MKKLVLAGFVMTGIGIGGLMCLAVTGCATKGGIVAWSVGTNHVDSVSSTAVNAATLRTAAQNSAGASNTVDAVDIDGSGGLDATVTPTP